VPENHADADPEKAAMSFVERSQKEAEEHLKVLTAEAEQLHGRLSKLEAGIKQWQTLVQALKTARQQAITSTAAGDEAPADVERAGVRGDKRKWSSTAPAQATAVAGAGDPPAAAPAAGAEALEPVPEAVPATARVLPQAVPATRPR
jgi:hypothetical protein